LKGFLRILQKTYPKRFNEAGDICPPPIAEIGARHLKKWGTSFRLVIFYHIVEEIINKSSLYKY